MKRLTEEDLKRYVANYERHKGGSVDTLMACYAAAAEALCNFLSPEWVFQHVFGRGKPAPYLRSVERENLDRYRHQDRVVDLAEKLFNLQGVQGIGERAKRMLTADIESVSAELDPAAMLFINGIPFHFVSESASPESVCDLRASIADSDVSCEIKCKVEGTQLSARTIRDSLEKARSQLPQDAPSIVFIRVPEAWSQNAEVSTSLKEAMGRVFRGSGRISAVIVHWEEWHQLRRGSAARIIKFQTEHNPNSRFPLFEHGAIINIPFHKGVNWRTIQDIVSGR